MRTPSTDNLPLSASCPLIFHTSELLQTGYIIDMDAFKEYATQNPALAVGIAAAAGAVVISKLFFAKKNNYFDGMPYSNFGTRLVVPGKFNRFSYSRPILGRIFGKVGLLLGKF
jgi:hypothetical protein